MGFYTSILFPRLLDATMAMPGLASHRRALLSKVYGHVLEIGFGTGANLPFFPRHVRKVVAVDSNAGMSSIAKKRMAAFDVEVELHVMNGEQLSFPNDTFDSVITSWTLCSVAHIEGALKEIHRVLKPDGIFCFLEHGLSPDRGVQKVQRILNGINRTVAAGCQLTREIPKLIEQAHFEIEPLQTFYIEKFPPTHGYMYQGVARKR